MFIIMRHLPTSDEPTRCVWWDVITEIEDLGTILLITKQFLTA